MRQLYSLNQVILHVFIGSNRYTQWYLRLFHQIQMMYYFLEHIVACDPFVCLSVASIQCDLESTRTMLFKECHSLLIEKYRIRHHSDTNTVALQEQIQIIESRVC